MKQENISALLEITSKTLLCAIHIGGALVTVVWDSVRDNCSRKRVNQRKEQKAFLVSVNVLFIGRSGYSLNF